MSAEAGPHRGSRSLIGRGVVAVVMVLERPGAGLRRLPPVIVEPAFAVECGGVAQLVADLEVVLDGATPLPLRLSFTRGRGEDYRLHVAHVCSDDDGGVIRVRRFMADDQVEAHTRVSRRRGVVVRADLRHA